MAGEDRAAAHPLRLLQELQDKPYQFDFYQALRLIECAFSESPRIGQSLRLTDEPIRLGQEPSLAFAPATLASCKQQSGGKPPKLSVNFLGLFGPNGPLPLHLTEYARDRLRHEDDPTFARFLDIFHHRLLALFYRAWANAQPAVQFDRPATDRFSVYVRSLIGIGMPSLRDRDELPDLAKLYYAGRLACQTRHPEGLRDMLADFFKLPVDIEEFIGQWTELPEDCRFLLVRAAESSTVGVACTLGSHVWDCQQKFRITIGPVDLEDFLRLLPGGNSLKRLTAMVRSYIGDELMWDLNVILKQEETPTWALGEQQLGRYAWLDNAGVKEDPRDLMLPQPTEPPSQQQEPIPI